MFSKDACNQVTVQTFTLLQISCFELSINQKILKNVSQLPKKNVNNDVSRAANHHFRMISE